MITREQILKFDPWELVALYPRNERGEAVVEHIKALAVEALSTRTELEAARAEIARCHERLEIDHVFVFDHVTQDLVREDIPMSKRLEAVDGIEARDITIQCLNNEIDDLEGELACIRHTPGVE